MNEHQEAFFEGMNLAFKVVFDMLPWIIIIFLICTYIFGWGMDPTDTSAMQRSGMRLHVDAETGVNYLSAGGQLIPRLSSDGSVYVDCNN